MKQIFTSFILLLCPYVLFAQWAQVGNDIDGEATNDQSGFAINLSADGNTLVIGARFNAEAGSASGHVKVFENNSNVWLQKGNDINGVAVSDQFGFSVSISADGNVIAAGAPDNNANGYEAGQVRVFEFQEGTWTQIGGNINGEAFSDHSGYSVCLSADGSRVAIGAPDNGMEVDVGSNFGHVRVYENLSGSWVQMGNDIDGENPEDNSGYAVSLNQDGSVVAIGAPNNSNATTGSGQVRVYSYQTDDWVQIGDDIDGEAMNDKFGGAVSLNNAGNILAVGAIDNNSIGHVRVFENLSDNWVQIGNDIDGEAVGDDFGVSVSLNDEGSVLAVGAHFNSGFAGDAGHARIYKNHLGDWQQIDDDIDGEASEDRSGHSVSLSDDGSIVAIGAYLNDGINGDNSGHVRVFSNTLAPVLGIKTINSKDKLIVYPTPATDKIHIDLEKNIPQFKILIYNLEGELMYSQDYKNSNYVTINTTSFSKGMYVLKLQFDQTYQSVKVVKQ